MDSRADVPGMDDIDIPELQKAVDNLARKMTGYFSKEEDRRDTAIPCLTSIFSVPGGVKIPSLYKAASSSGHNTAVHGAGTMVENWSMGVSALPQIKLVCYVAHLNAKGMGEVDAWWMPVDNCIYNGGYLASD
jgi:hypothetical protein